METQGQMSELEQAKCSKLDTKVLARLASWERRYVQGLSRLSTEAIPLTYKPRQNPQSRIRAQSHKLYLLLLTFLILGFCSHPTSFHFALCYKWLRWESSHFPSKIECSPGSAMQLRKVFNWVVSFRTEIKFDIYQESSVTQRDSGPVVTGVIKKNEGCTVQAWTLTFSQRSEVNNLYEKSIHTLNY